MDILIQLPARMISLEWALDSVHDWRDAPHKSLYWYDKDADQPYHLENEYGHGNLDANED